MAGAARRSAVRRTLETGQAHQQGATAGL